MGGAILGSPRSQECERGASLDSELMHIQRYEGKPRAWEKKTKAENFGEKRKK